MVFDLKLIVAGIVTAGLAGTFLLSNATVGNLVGDFREKVDIGLWPKAQQTEEAARSIQFVLSVDKHDIMDFSGEGLQIEISGATQGDVAGGSFTTDSVSLSGFNGKGSIDESLTLNGSAETIKLSDASVSFPGKSYNSNSEFSSATIDNLFINQLELKGVTGTLEKDGSQVRFSSADVSLKNVRGKFSFGGGLRIDGAASMISIPSSGIRIV